MAHLGWRFEDDYANPLRAILRGTRGVDALLAGHSHQDKPSWTSEGVLCSQASYHGIHLGRLDLSFDLATRKLIAKEATTARMDATHALDPRVLELAKPDLDATARELATKVATLTRTLPGQGRDNQVARLLCECFAEALAGADTPVDGVFHGTFGTGDLAPGELTVGDCWRLIPYENLLVTAELGVEELVEVLREERALRKSDRILWPFEVRVQDKGERVSIQLRGKELDPAGRFRIAFNTYDAQSGGRALPRLRELLASPAARRQGTAIDTRGALIEGLRRRGTIS
jgi:2',3'-cyclic-nucleotide 2'-phosphodiesterase (5'-nucleotidase family)